MIISFSSFNICAPQTRGAVLISLESCQDQELVLGNDGDAKLLGFLIFPRRALHVVIDQEICLFGDRPCYLAALLRDVGLELITVGKMLHLAGNDEGKALKVAKKIDSLYHSIAGHSDGGVQILLAKEVGNIAPDDRAVDELVVFVPASCSKNLFDRLSATLGLIAYDPLYL